MLKRTYSIYNKIGDIDERSKYLKKRKRVIFRDKPIIKEYYKVNNDLNKLLCEYINMYIDIDYNRLKLLNNYFYNYKKQIFEYVCYITTIKNSEDRINLLNMLQIHPDDKELQLYVDNALEEIKIAYVFDNSI
tara:strand:- start:290 stop:688 length:399 start_codon:yes stop_codon:yes gene_type:complete